MNSNGGMESHVRGFLRGGENILLLTEADLAPDGTYGISWMAVTPSRLLVFRGNGAEPSRRPGAPENARDDAHVPDEGPCLDIELDSIQSVRPAAHVGHMVLQAYAGDTKIPLVHYTNSLSDRYARIAKSLNDKCVEKRPLNFEDDDAGQRYCPECGRLLLEKDGFCRACLKKRELLVRLWGYMKPYWRRILVIIGMIGLTTALGLMPPYLIKVLVDDVFVVTDAAVTTQAPAASGGEPASGTPAPPPEATQREPDLLFRIIVATVGASQHRQLIFLVLSLVVAAILTMGLRILQGRITATLSSSIIHDVRLDFYQSIQGLHLKRYDKTQTGALLSRLNNDTQMLNHFFLDSAVFIFPQILLLVGICFVLFTMHWVLALLVLIPSPLVIAMTRWFHRRIHGRFHRMWQRRSTMTSRANDSISGIRVVKAFAQERSEINQFGRRSAGFRDASIDAETFLATYFPFMEFTLTFGTFLVWYFGGLGVLKQGPVIWHTVSFGTLMAFLAYLNMFYGPLRMMARLTNFFNRAFTAAQRLFEITDSDQEVYEAVQAKPLDEIRGHFVFEDVHFSYDKDKPVLKGVNAEVQPGEMIGLVGRSGVGKSTLINLVCRFYDVDEGAIRLDGTNLRDIRLRDLRRHIGIVPQEPFLFNATVGENIAYGNPDATREDVMRAAIAANAHGFILRQPDGYDTRVGERGARLSGGERQRIAIARAILHDPRILILDEATSSVDTETEELIQNALERLVQGRTTFAIAHRLSTLRNANRLFVIDDGKIAEMGTHEELIEQKGIYQRLVDIQSRLSSLTAVGG